MRIFHFPLRAHRAMLCSAGGHECHSRAPIPRQLVLVRDEDLAALRAYDGDHAGQRRVPARGRDRMIDLTHW